MPTFYEFFAGGGMARLGLGPRWQALVANDFSKKKADCYVANWGGEDFLPGCISTLSAADLPCQADLAWASFPCQDLSLAGKRRGIYSGRSGAFWPFWQLMVELGEAGRQPPVITLENVTGMLSANGGQDFADVCTALIEGGYRVGAAVIDAQLFTPQSRKRVFVIATRANLIIPDELVSAKPDERWHPPAMTRAIDKLPDAASESWFWLTLPEPKRREISLADLIEDHPSDVAWRDDGETQQLLAMMSEVNRHKIDKAACTNERIVGTLYRRTRPGPNGSPQQRAEVRFDVAGCLRTPGGGSSRQTLVVVDCGQVRTRLLSAREAARLMGIPDSYQLPPRYNDAYHLAGDGVVVPVVRFLAKEVLEPILKGR